MAKKKTEEADAFLNELDTFLTQKTGTRIKTIDEVDAVKAFTSTGNYALNFCFSGSLHRGYPIGRITSLEGLSGHGKSLESTRMAYEHIKKSPESLAFIIDIERSIVKDFLINVCGKDEAGMARIKIVQNIQTLEDLQLFLKRLIEFQASKKSKREIVVVIDSWSALSSDHEVDIADKEKTTRDMTKAVQARAMLRTLNQDLEDYFVTLIPLMHITEKVGVMFGNPQTPASHGSAMIFYASVRFELLASKEIHNDDGLVIGQSLTFKGKKNRFTYKGKSATIDYYFVGEKRGLDPLSGMVKLMVEWKIFDSSVKKISDIDGKTTITYIDDSGRTWEFKNKDFNKFVEDLGGEEKFIATMEKHLQDKLQGTNDREKLLQSYNEKDEDLSDEELAELVGDVTPAVSEPVVTKPKKGK